MNALTRMVVLAAATAAATLATASATGNIPHQVFAARGGAPDGIRPTVDRFAAALGGPDRASAPPAASGRRSIDWDADQVPFAMPGDFFNTAAPRGAVFRVRGGEFRVSDPPAGHPTRDTRFSTFNPRLASWLVPFSQRRLFTPLRHNVMEVHFEVPGRRGVLATTAGFGVVLVGVDREFISNVAYYDATGRRLAKVFVPARSGGLSFLGVMFKEPLVAFVRITLGNRRVNEREVGHGDVVVAGDILYGEPVRA